MLARAESLGDHGTIAHALLEASAVAEGEGQLITARCYAERAREHYVTAGDVFGIARCQTALGGLAFLLGRTDEAQALLRQSFAILLDLGRDVEAAFAFTALAQVHLHRDELEDAERLARRALVFIGSRTDHRAELGTAQRILGQALLRQGRSEEAEELLAEAEHTLATASRLG